MFNRKTEKMIQLIYFDCFARAEWIRMILAIDNKKNYEEIRIKWDINTSTVPESDANIWQKYKKCSLYNFLVFLI
jgi:hypothetical protein